MGANTSSAWGESATQLQLVKIKLDNYKIISLQPPHSQSPTQLHALVTLLASIGYPLIAASSSTALVLAHCCVARRGDYLLNFLTQYNFTKDIVNLSPFNYNRPHKNHHISTTSINIFPLVSLSLMPPRRNRHPQPNSLLWS